MVTSPSFRRLLEECILPLLQKQALLAFPEDARHRDEYILIFSIEILMTIQSNEHHLLNTFERHRRIDRNKVQDAAAYRTKSDHFVISALEKIKIVPQKVSRTEVMQFVEDILPKVGKSREQELTYPQWEWVLCIVAVKAVSNAIGRNSAAWNTRLKVCVSYLRFSIISVTTVFLNTEYYSFCFGSVSCSLCSHCSK